MLVFLLKLPLSVARLEEESGTWISSIVVTANECLLTYIITAFAFCFASELLPISIEISKVTTFDW